MKIRRFYPRQVLNRLRDRRVDALSPGEHQALAFFMRPRGRYRYALSIREDGTVCLVGGRGLTILSGRSPPRAPALLTGAGVDVQLFASVRNVPVEMEVEVGVQAPIAIQASALAGTSASEDDGQSGAWSRAIRACMRLKPDTIVIADDVTTPAASHACDGGLE